MYVKPRLEKFGDFRELTQLLGSGVNDPINGPGDNDGCYYDKYSVGSPTCWQPTTS
ncbi:hypothetical protein D3C83_200880 [compost metagenome]